MNRSDIADVVARWLVGDSPTLTSSPRFQNAVAAVARELALRDALDHDALSTVILSGLLGRPVVIASLDVSDGPVRPLRRRRNVEDVSTQKRPFRLIVGGRSALPESPPPWPRVGSLG